MDETTLKKTLTKRYKILENHLVKLYKKFEKSYAKTEKNIKLSHNIVETKGRMDEITNIILLLNKKNEM